MKPFPLNSRPIPSKRWEQKHMFRGNYTRILLVLTVHLWDWELIWRKIIKLTIFLLARHPFNPPPTAPLLLALGTPWSTELGLAPQQSAPLPRLFLPTESTNCQGMATLQYTKHPQNQPALLQWVNVQKATLISSAPNPTQSISPTTPYSSSQRSGGRDPLWAHPHWEKNSPVTSSGFLESSFYTEISSSITFYLHTLEAFWGSGCFLPCLW